MSPPPIPIDAKERLTRRFQDLEVVGRFHSLQCIGLGGMGAVFRAKDRTFEDKIVAVKMMVPDQQPGAGNDEVRSELTHRFRRESQITGQLDSAHVARAIDCGIVEAADHPEGLPFLALEFVDGPNLQELVRAEGPLAPRRALALLRQLAEALVEVHRKQIVHRDIKPLNIMLRDYVKGAASGFHLKLLDFGIARLADEGGAAPPPVPPSPEAVEERTVRVGTALGQFLGSLEYAAPEQFANRHTPKAYFFDKDVADTAALLPALDARADLYAVGGVLYFLLTGAAPFHAIKGLYPKMRAHLLTPPPKLPGRIDKRVRALCRRLLAKDPAARPQSATALIAEIDACLAPAPVLPFVAFASLVVVVLSVLALKLLPDPPVVHPAVRPPVTPPPVTPEPPQPIPTPPSTTPPTTTPPPEPKRDDHQPNKKLDRVTIDKKKTKKPDPELPAGLKPKLFTGEHAIFPDVDPAPDPGTKSKPLAK